MGPSSPFPMKYVVLIVAVIALAWFGFSRYQSKSEPAAENTTKAGRAKNRRVEIRSMVNKGIAGTPTTGSR